MRTSYSERDYTFGQAMLTLRTALGLTQAELANSLGVSRRAVGEWEAGSSYPKMDHLKQLIMLGIEQKAWAPGHEAEEIRLLWRRAHQKVLLDERWLSALLEHSHASPSQTRPSPAPPIGVSETVSCTPDRLTSGTLVDWGDALAVPSFYGRKEEQAQLSQWIIRERCRVVSVLGMGGIGKSALSVSVMYQLAEQFEVVVFRLLRDAPALETLLDECLQVLSPEPIRTIPATLEERISLFLDSLRKRRALVVLDNLESLLQEGDLKGQLRPGFLGYGQLLQRVAETAHQSCLLLTSRERLAILRTLEGSSVRSLRLGGLDGAACSQLFMEKQVVGTESEQAQLIEAYSGNPLALKIVGQTIFDLFGGEIGPFLAGGTAIFGCITDLLDEQFERLSRLSQSMLCWLAIVREPVTLDELLALQVVPLCRIQLLEAIDAGYQRSLIERGKGTGSFTLQSVVLEYVTAHLVAQGSREIKQGRLMRLREHGLEQSHAKEYVRQTQERMLLCPLLANLQNTFHRQGTFGGEEPRTVESSSVEEQLLSLLASLREQEDSAQGYGPANLIALLRLQRGHLSALDLSRLFIRGAYLQGVEMRDTSLAGATMSDTVLTEAVNATWAVAIAPSGRWWAAGSMQGKVRLWDEESQALRLIWQAHTSSVYALAFSPDGWLLASGSYDGTVKLWDVESGTLLWTGWQKSPISLAFSPCGTLLASAGADATVRLWDPRSGTNLETLTHPSQVYAVAFSPDGNLLASGCFDGWIRLWEKRKTEALIWVETQEIKTCWITSLVFAPDGRTIASAHQQDQTVRLWQVEGLRLRETLSDIQAKYLAWSPDGRTLACSGSGKTIWLYDVEQGRIRSVLHGHASNIHAIAFAPNSRQLLSGSTDGTLRVWNVESRETVRIIAGYGVTLFNLDWSPDGTHLVSGGTDTVVTTWDVSGGTPPSVLRGHTWFVFGVGWSPDGRSLASCSWDKTIRLWDPISGECRQRFKDSSTLLLSVAWSPDGSRLACGTYLQGMQMWDVRTQSLCWLGLPYQTIFRDVAWSPDGTRLASSGSDGSVYLWECGDGTLQKRLSGHRGWVMSVAWSPDGTRLASGSLGEGSGELFMWDVESGERLRAFAGHSGQVCAVAWSPRGGQLISGDSDGMLRWWDIETGECVGMRAAHEGTIRSLKVSPDGRWLGSCGDDGEVIRIWDVESFEHLRTLRCDRPYERLNITGIRGLNETQKSSLRALGAIGG